jgi:hypothetical protein
LPTVILISQVTWTSIEKPFLSLRTTYVKWGWYLKQYSASPPPNGCIKPIGCKQPGQCSYPDKFHHQINWLHQVISGMKLAL